MFVLGVEQSRRIGNPHGPTSRPKEGGPFCCDIASVTSGELHILDWMDLGVCISKSDAHRF